MIRNDFDEQRKWTGLATRAPWLLSQINRWWPGASKTLDILPDSQDVPEGQLDFQPMQVDLTFMFEQRPVYLELKNRDMVYPGDILLEHAWMTKGSFADWLVFAWHGQPKSRGKYEWTGQDDEDVPGRRSVRLYYPALRATYQRFLSTWLEDPRVESVSADNATYTTKSITVPTPLLVQCMTTELLGSFGNDEIRTIVGYDEGTAEQEKERAQAVKDQQERDRKEKEEASRKTLAELNERDYGSKKKSAGAA